MILHRLVDEYDLEAHVSDGQESAGERGSVGEGGNG